MAFLNDNYLKLKAGYLFPEIGRRVKAFCDANPEAAKRLIRCGIGDVTEPLPPAAIAAMHRAVDEMAGARRSRATARSRATNGCAPPSPRTISAIAAATWRTTKFSSATAPSATPATSSTSLGHKNKIAVTDPVYPVYVDTNVMAGHTGEANEARALTRSSFICRANQATASSLNRRSGTWT